MNFIKKKKYKLVVFILMLVSIFNISYSKNIKLKVGVSEGAGKNAYNKEYLMEISKYTGLEYEFVENIIDKDGNKIPLYFEKSLEMLEKGELDIVGGITKTTERENKFFSRFIHQDTKKEY